MILEVFPTLTILCSMIIQVLHPNMYTVYTGTLLFAHKAHPSVVPSGFLEGYLGTLSIYYCTKELNTG